MKLELNDQEAELLELLLVKEIEETRVEIHHAKNIDFKANLTSREKGIHVLLSKFNHPIG